MNKTLEKTIDVSLVAVARQAISRSKLGLAPDHTIIEVSKEKILEALDQTLEAQKAEIIEMLEGQIQPNIENPYQDDEGNEALLDAITKIKKL